MKCEPGSNKPANPTDQRTLKAEIKVGTDKTAGKNAEIYSGALGLFLHLRQWEIAPRVVECLLHVK